MAYPVTFDIQPPERFDKTQVFIRILIVIVLAVLGGSITWIFGAAYLIFPVVAAILISQKGAQPFLDESHDNVTKWLRYVVAAYAYMGLLTDRLPNQDPEETFQFSVQPGGTPTAGSALVRIVFGIPSAFVLAVFSLAFLVVLPVAAISILMNETYPAWAYNFSRGFLRWQTRLLAYMSSLVDEYPPYSFQNGTATAPVESPPPVQPTG